MPRKSLIRSDFLPYHVTARTNNREQFHLPLELVWKILTDELYLASIRFEAEIHAFVVMPNHFHLLISTPKQDLGEIMRDYLSYASRTLNLKSGRSGRVFGARYHWSLIESGHYYAHALKYVYRNPVKAGLSERVENFRYSTLHGLMGRSPLPLPLHYPRCGHGISLVPTETQSLLEWLNRPFPNEVDATLRKTFRRATFEISKGNKRKSPEWARTLV